MSWFKKLKEGLKKSSGKITEGVAGVVSKRKLDNETLEQLEEVLIAADLGVETAAKLIAHLAKEKFDKEVSDEEVRSALSDDIAEILRPVAKAIDTAKGGTQVLLVVGVNGNGKTTTIGKLAQQMKQDGKKVMLAACDTFRAAAVEQLTIWSERVGCPIITGEQNADPASVAYKSFEKARNEGIDVLIIDTAGRLQNKQHLMEELAKIIRVLQKIDENAPHDTVLVLDATTGQNAHSQVETFKDKVNITGLIVTKLDGTAKGGVVVALAQKFGLPIHTIGVGEEVEDMQPFDATNFARSLMGL